jgi:hypothetical protein
MTSVVVTPVLHSVTVDDSSSTRVTVVTGDVRVVSVGTQGPAGIPGPQGPQGAPGAASAPPGSDTAVFYGAAGGFGADLDYFTYDAGTKALRITKVVDLSLDGGNF